MAESNSTNCTSKVYLLTNLPSISHDKCYNKTRKKIKYYPKQTFELRQNREKIFSNLIFMQRISAHLTDPINKKIFLLNYLFKQKKMLKKSIIFCQILTKITSKKGESVGYFSD